MPGDVHKKSLSVKWLLFDKLLFGPEDANGDSVAECTILLPPETNMNWIS